MKSLAIGETINNLIIRAKHGDRYLVNCITCQWGDWFRKSLLLSGDVKCNDCEKLKSRTKYNPKLQHMILKHERRLRDMKKRGIQIQ